MNALPNRWPPTPAETFSSTYRLVRELLTVKSDGSDSTETKSGSTPSRSPFTCFCPDREQADTELAMTLREHVKRSDQPMWPSANETK